jgi:hypothetical protein
MATKKTAAKKTTEKKTAPTKATAKKPAAPPASPKKAAATKASEKAASEKTVADKKKVADKKAPAATKASEKAAPEKKAAAARPVAEKKATPARPVEKAAAEKKATPARPSERPPAEKKAPPARKATEPGADGAPAVAASGISVEEAQKILAEVQEGRKQPKGECHAALPLKLVNPRHPRSVSELSRQDLRQLVAAGANGMGEARTPEDWLDPDGESYHGDLEIWDVADAHGIPVYSLWIYRTDNGTVFRAHTIDVVGGISEGGLECTEEGLEEAIIEAKARIDKGALKSLMLRFVD